MAALSPASAAASAANTRRIFTSAETTPRNAYNGFAVQFKPLADRSAAETEYKYLVIDTSKPTATLDNTIALIEEAKTQKIGLLHLDKASITLSELLQKLADKAVTKEHVTHFGAHDKALAVEDIPLISRLFPNLTCLDLENKCTAEFCAAIEAHLPNLTELEFADDEMDEYDERYTFASEEADEDEDYRLLEAPEYSFLKSFLANMTKLKVFSMSDDCSIDPTIILEVLSTSPSLINFNGSSSRTIHASPEVLDFLHTSRAADLPYFHTLSFDDHDNMTLPKPIDLSKFPNIKRLDLPAPGPYPTEDHLNLYIAFLKQTLETLPNPENIKILNFQISSISHSTGAKLEPIMYEATALFTMLLETLPGLQQINGHFNKPDIVILRQMTPRQISSQNCENGKVLEWSEALESLEEITISPAFLTRIPFSELPKRAPNLTVITLNKELCASDDLQATLTSLIKAYPHLMSIDLEGQPDFDLSELDQHKRSTMLPIIDIESDDESYDDDSDASSSDE